MNEKKNLIETLFYFRDENTFLFSNILSGLVVYMKLKNDKF